MARQLRDLEQELLLARCQLGDREAFAEFVRHWEAKLLYYLRRLTPQEADAWDALQRTWLVVFRDMVRLKSTAALRPWLYRVARHQAVNQFRDGWTRHLKVDEAVDPDEVGEPDWTPGLADVDRIHAALQTLTLPHRDVVTLYFLEQLSLAEIAEVVGVPIGTVKSRLHFAKRELQRRLLREGKTDEHA